jgi:arylsulfatase A
MNRKLTWISLLSYLFLQALALSAERPNILFILTDDQGWPTLESYGGKIVPTPNLDKLASEGARLSDFYVTSQCSPTRATFMTGQYTARHRLWHVLPWYGYPWARVTEPPYAGNYSRDTFTIAKGLRAAGYATAIVGKWHLTNNEDGHYNGLNPEAAHFYGFDYAPPVIAKSYFEEGSDRGVDLFTDQTIDFISKHKDRPWFVYLSHHMIHGVVVAPNDLTNQYRDKGYGDEGPNRAVYLAGLEHIDHSIGRLMAALEKLGEAENTLVVFTSDNGGIDYKFDFKQGVIKNGAPTLPIEMYEYDNAPLRMGKGSGYEGGIRVPFIVRWPGKVKAGQTISTPAHIVDMLPTFFSAAGAKPPKSHPIDGENLLPLFTGKSSNRLNQRPVYQYYPFYDLRWGITPSASIRSGDYKLLEFFGERVGDDGQFYPGNQIELYNLRVDPGESRNLAAQESKIAKKLKNQLHTWVQDIGAEIPKPNPHYIPDRQLDETREKPDWLE